MRLDQLTTLEAIRQVLDGTQAVVFPLAGNKRERYRRVQKTLVQHAYWRLGKADKGTVTRYLMKVTGYPHAQIKRLIRQYAQTGAVRLKPARHNGFPRRYSAADIRLLAAMDERHNRDQAYRYINFHRPCYFPTTITDETGKERRQYRYDDMMTAYEKFRSLPRPSHYLKPGVTLKQLNAFANETTDNDAAEQLNQGA